ncbi:hypothetical protein KR018_005615 [Drosophila ironensis]|nr:hypothetical protein KR018_005615 [Drosophila ironensis]
MFLKKIFGQKCCTVCLFVSIWGFIMLNTLGILFYLEALDLLRDLPWDPKWEWDTLEDFKKRTEEAFQDTAIKCFVTGLVYLFFIFLSIYLIRRDKKKRQLLYKRKSQKDKDKP